MWRALALAVADLLLAEPGKRNDRTADDARPVATGEVSRASGQHSAP